MRDRADEHRDDLVVAALHRLAPALDGEPDPAFRAATRARLVAMAAVRTPEPEPASGLKRLLAGRAADATRPRWHTRFTAGLAGAALTVTAAASLVALAGRAHPGDVLYGLKRGTEQTQLALAGNSRGTTLLGFASTRLAELHDLVDSTSALPAGGGAVGPGGTVLAAGADPELVISTLETMDDETAQGTAWLTDRAVTTAGDAPLDDVSLWVAAQADGLAALAPALPDAAGAAVEHSKSLLSQVAVRTDELRTALTCSSGPSVTRADALGPVPASCVPPAAETAGPQVGGGVPGSTSGTAPTTGAVPTPGGTNGNTTGNGGGVTVPGTPTIPGGVGLPSVPGGLPSVPGGLPSVPGGLPSIPGGLPSIPGGLPSIPGTGLKLPGGTVPTTVPCLPVVPC